MNIIRYTEIPSAARALPPRASESGGPRRPSRTPPPMPDLPVLDDEDPAFELEVVQPDDEEGIEESERPSVLIPTRSGRICWQVNRRRRESPAGLSWRTPPASPAWRRAN